MSNIPSDVAYEQMQKRYRRLCHMYFNPKPPQYDEDGELIPSTEPTRSQIVQMFEQMGVELPMSPNTQMQMRPGGPVKHTGGE